jgi:hypothetical protein
VHEEVEAAVLKMGFIKRDEFDALSARLAALEDTLAQSKTPPAKRKISLGKLATSKLASGKSAKKSAEDKGEKK